MACLFLFLRPKSRADTILLHLSPILCSLAIGVKLFFAPNHAEGLWGDSLCHISVARSAWRTLRWPADSSSNLVLECIQRFCKSIGIFKGHFPKVYVYVSTLKISTICRRQSLIKTLNLGVIGFLTSTFWTLFIVILVFIDRCCGYLRSYIRIRFQFPKRRKTGSTGTYLSTLSTIYRQYLRVQSRALLMSLVFQTFIFRPTAAASLCMSFIFFYNIGNSSITAYLWV